MVDQIGTFIVDDPEDSLIYQQNFVDFPSNFTAQEKASLQNASKSVIKTSVRPQ